MKRKLVLCVLLLLMLSQFGCHKAAEGKERAGVSELEQAELAILRVLNNETKAAFNRDYQAWQAYWVQEDYVTKTYMNFADSTMTETLGWQEISGFVKNYFEEHPTPVPLPALIDEIDVRLYENGAWVNYEQIDASLGLKRETRLMEKSAGQWKIVGMQTIIYGHR